MSEKLCEPANQEQMLGCHELFRAVSEQELLSILQRVDRPLHWLEIERSLGNDGDSAIYALRTQPIMQKLIDAGQIAPLKEFNRETGFFALVELPETLAQDGHSNKQAADNLHDKNKPRRHELLPTNLMIEDNLLAILQQARKPIDFKAIRKQLKPSGLQIIDPLYVKQQLGKLIKEGAVIRVARSVYAVPEFAEENYQRTHSRKVKAAMDKITRVITESGKPLRSYEIIQRLAQEKNSEYAVKNSSVLLKLAIAEGEICKLKQGLYVSSELAERIQEELLAADKETRAPVIKVLEQADKPLQRKVIYARMSGVEVKDVDTRKPPYRSFLATIKSMIEQEDVAVFGRNTLCLPQKVEEWRGVFLTLEERVTRVLQKAGKPLHYEDAFKAIIQDGGESVSLGNVNAKLNSMAGKGVAARVEGTRGIFALPEFVEEAYDSREISIEQRIVAVFERIHGHEIDLLTIREEVLADGGRSVSLQSISSTLNKMAGASKDEDGIFFSFNPDYKNPDTLR